MLGFVQHEVAAGHDAGGGGAGTLGLAGFIPAQQGADAFNQQALAERLGDVVVSAEAQAHQLIDFLILGGQEDNRDGAALAQALQQFHPVHAGHLDIEHGEVHRAGGHALQRAFTVCICTDLKAFLFQRHGDAGQDVAVVVNQGDGLLHRAFLASRLTGTIPCTPIWRMIMADCGTRVNKSWHSIVDP